MFSKLFGAIARLFSRKKFGGYNAISEMDTDSSQDFTNKQY